MSKAREQILRRLTTGRPDTDWASSPQRHPAPPAQASEKWLPRLLDAMTQNRFEVAPRGPDQRKQLISSLASQNLKRWLIGTSTLADTFAPLIGGVPDTEITRFSEDFESLKEHIFDRVDIGLSSAYAAIAETGTLLLRPDAAEPRTLSLIPPVHVVVLNPKQIFENLDDCLASFSTSDLRQNSNTVLISGPSKTADIQQKLAYGAHGPKRVIVLLEEN